MISRRPAQPRAPSPPRWAGDDAVPRGLAVASAVVLRLLIVIAGLVVLGLAAEKLLLVVLPFAIAMLLSTLLSPVARVLERHRVRPGIAAALAVTLALLVFAGLWALIIPPAIGQADDLATRVQQGLGKVADTLKPLGIDSGDLDNAVDQALAAAKQRALPAAMIAAQWAGATVLIVVLTFFFVKDGRRIWCWFVDLVHPDRRDAVQELGDRAWTSLSVYFRGVIFVATVDAVFIGVALLIVGVPIALPLIVLTFVAAFFPIIGATVAGAAAVLVALVSNGMLAAFVILAVILVVQQLEGNVLYPVVVGRRLRLHPVAMLVALTAGGVLAGVAGAFLAVPAITVIAAVLEFVRERREADERPAVLEP